jgi:hypothetical protein
VTTPQPGCATVGDTGSECSRATNPLNPYPHRNRETSFLERRTNVPVAQRERAEENRAYVRRLLRERQPEFAAALAAVERSFSCPACPGERDQDDDRALDDCASA